VGRCNLPHKYFLPLVVDGKAADDRRKRRLLEGYPKVPDPLDVPLNLPLV
jgi:hypothetical protein